MNSKHDRNLELHNLDGALAPGPTGIGLVIHIYPVNVVGNTNQYSSIAPSAEG